MAATLERSASTRSHLTTLLPASSDARLTSHLGGADFRPSSPLADGKVGGAMRPRCCQWNRGGWLSVPACALAGVAGRPGCGALCYQYCTTGGCNVDKERSANGDKCCKDGVQDCVSGKGKTYETLGATASDGSPGAAGALASPGVQGDEGEVDYFPGTLIATGEVWPLPLPTL